MRDTGHELFHADVGTGLACASCHGEALDDGHVWNFKDVGPRRTQNMRGGLSKTLPLHWEGDLATFDKLVDEVMTRRMGGFVVEEQYAGALAGWLDKQPAMKLERASDADGQSRAARSCSSRQRSRARPATPARCSPTTRRSTWARAASSRCPRCAASRCTAPFMHDGCAQTLSDRFDAPCGGGDKHGKTSQLSKAQIADLVAYLETL